MPRISQRGPARYFSILSALLPLLLLAITLQAAARPSGRYAAKRLGEVVQLSDSKKQVEVSIAPRFGDTVFSLRAHGHETVFFPDRTPEQHQANADLAGIPLLAPWANRLDDFALFANGKRYAMNASLGNLTGDPPVHGFLSRASDWQIVDMRANRQAAWLTSRLDFYRHPDWMAQFPFAHTIEITQKLHDGVLEVHTRIVNLSVDAMPVLIGFHPFLHLTDTDKMNWRIQLPATTHYLLRQNDLPTGETETITQRVKDPAHADPSDLDDVFGDLTRNAAGNATFVLTGKRQQLQITFGPKYLVAIIYSPKPTASTADSSAETPVKNSFVCVEPMASLTNATSLHQQGKSVPLQQVGAGQVWEESFWIEPKDF